ncbi:hypothetical protein IJ818_01845, partial [bacterium]|nr:hypothetical protein [bacterium]MBR1907661.1 hypothetical protein [bacterium]
TNPCTLTNCNGNKCTIKPKGVEKEVGCGSQCIIKIFDCANGVNSDGSCNNTTPDPSLASNYCEIYFSCEMLPSQGEDCGISSSISEYMSCSLSIKSGTTCTDTNKRPSKFKINNYEYYSNDPNMAGVVYQKTQQESVTANINYNSAGSSASLSTNINPHYCFVPERTSILGCSWWIGSTEYTSSGIDEHQECSFGTGG